MKRRHAEVPFEERRFAGLCLVALGCILLVSCEILAYQDYVTWVWSVLLVPALLELAGLTLFAINILGTFVLEPRRFGFLVRDRIQSRQDHGLN